MAHGLTCIGMSDWWRDIKSCMLYNPHVVADYACVDMMDWDHKCQVVMGCDSQRMPMVLCLFEGHVLCGPPMMSHQSTSLIWSGMRRMLFQAEVLGCVQGVTMTHPVGVLGMSHGCCTSSPLKCLLVSTAHPPPHGLFPPPFLGEWPIVPWCVGCPWVQDMIYNHS